jgi:hypothetical protein
MRSQGRILAPSVTWMLAAALVAVAACGNGDTGPGDHLPAAAPEDASIALDGGVQWQDVGAQANDVGVVGGDAGGQPPGVDAGSVFTCTGAGIAAFADQLVAKARQTCTSNGVGVVKMNNYQCMQTAITQAAPPYPDASHNVVTETMRGATAQYPYFECTFFVQTVTAGVCGTAISPPGKTLADTPFAYTFANTQIPGYTWVNKSQGGVRVGDVMVWSSSNPSYDPGHIMIVAEVLDSNRFRIAEANALYSNGSEANGTETGVLSNTRIQTLNDSVLAGWQRPNTP